MANHWRRPNAALFKPGIRRKVHQNEGYPDYRKVRQKYNMVAGGWHTATLIG